MISREMVTGRIQAFFGDDLSDTVDSLLSAPGAFGNVVVAAARQVRLVDGHALGVVLAGWIWLILGYGVMGNHGLPLAALAVLPTVLWLAAGVTGGLFFEIGGIGIRSLAYWESYLLILLFACFGLISLRLALNPRDRRVYRPAPSKVDG
jgi:hypothetical protein